MEPGSSFSFELVQKKGAALVTKCLTFREDIDLEAAFEEYTKHHYRSWVSFAREKRLGNDIKPVIVTGVDMTKDFAMMAYSNNGTRLSSKFTISAPLAGSSSVTVWGKWDAQGLVHTNCGPYLSTPPPPPDTPEPQRVDISSREIPKQYNQCVFVRYYTIRWRAFLFPKVIKAAAGPHDPGPWDYRDEDFPELATESSSDQGIEFDGEEDSTTNDLDLFTAIHDSEFETSHDASSVRLPPP